MIKSRIVTQIQRYEFEIPAEHAADVVLAFDWLEAQIYGPNKGYIELPGRIIYIADPDSVCGIDIWQEGEPDALTLAATVGAQIAEDGAPDLYTLQPVEFLGNQITLQGVMYRLRGYMYFLPHTANNAPALELLTHETLGQLTDQALRQDGLSGTVILPPVQLDNFMLASEYVMDYAEQVTPAAHFSPSDKTGRAARGLWDEK